MLVVAVAAFVVHLAVATAEIRGVAVSIAEILDILSSFDSDHHSREPVMPLDELSLHQGGP